MKFILALTSLISISFAQANVIELNSIQKLEANMTAISVSLIDWKIGDSQDYKVKITNFGLEGTMHKEVLREEGEAVWFSQQLTLPIMNDKSEILIDRNSGEILKYVHNGKEESVPKGDIEIISTDNTTVEVPAGKFKVMHIVAKSKDVPKIEIWANPREISMDGGAKTAMDQGQVSIVMELTKFKKQ